MNSHPHAGWLGYSDEKLRSLCKEALEKGFRDFKLKVGNSIDDDNRRLRIVREVGNERRSRSPR